MRFWPGKGWLGIQLAKCTGYALHWSRLRMRFRNSSRSRRAWCTGCTAGTFGQARLNQLFSHLVLLKSYQKRRQVRQFQEPFRPAQHFESAASSRSSTADLASWSPNLQTGDISTRYCGTATRSIPDFCLSSFRKQRRGKKWRRILWTISFCVFLLNRFRLWKKQYLLLSRLYRDLSDPLVGL